MGATREDTLRRLVDRAADELADATATDVLTWADKALGGRMVVATSLTDAVVIDLAAQVRPGIDVVFLDTGYHFVETLGMREAVEAAYAVRLMSAKPGQTVEEQDAAYGERLYERNPDLCCYLRKVVPLNTMLGRYDGWVTGLRRGETADRVDAHPVEWDANREMVKINPIVGWTDDELDAYRAERGLLVNPLLAAGYTSIGCAPCTAHPVDGADRRSGRWAGTGKTECGIHT